MTPGIRKLTFTAHVTSSVGWLGAVIAYLAVAVAGLTSRDAEMVRAAYLVTALIGWLVIVPLSFAALVTGLVQSLATEWGLFRHYWVASKFVLTVAATIVLLIHMQTVGRMARLAMDVSLSGGDHRGMRMQLVVHAAGGLLVLVTATVLSIYKPWGRTPYGRRELQSEGASSRRPRPWPTGRLVLLAVIALLVVVLLLHLTGRGFVGH